MSWNGFVERRVACPTTARATAFVSLALFLMGVTAACGPEVQAGDLPASTLGAPTAEVAGTESTAGDGVPSAAGNDSGSGLPAGRTTAALTGDVLAVTAVLYSDEDAEVASRISGFVREVKAELGDAVEAGQVLATLDDGREVARVASAQAAFENARSEQEKARPLFDQKIIGELEYERVVLKLRSTEAALAEAQVELSYTRITAPFAGVVTRRMTGLGRSVAEGAPLFRVTGLRPLRALVRVPENEARRIRAGAAVQLSGVGGEEVRGMVLRISPAVDAQAGTVELLVDVPQPGVLRPGSSVTARIAIGG